MSGLVLAINMHQKTPYEKLDLRQYTAWLDITVGVNFLLLIVVSLILSQYRNPLSNSIQCKMIMALAFCFVQAILVVIGIFLLIAVRANIRLYLRKKA